jgi:hypothetical protein
MVILRQDKLGGIQHTSEGPSQRYRTKVDVVFQLTGSLMEVRVLIHRICVVSEFKKGS